MKPSNGEPAVPEEGKKPFFKAFPAKLRKRHIMETLAAFIGGRWLLVGNYKFPEETIDLTVVSVIGASKETAR